MKETEVYRFNVFIQSNDLRGFLQVPHSNVPHPSTFALSTKIGSIALNEHKRTKAMLQE